MLIAVQALLTISVGLILFIIFLNIFNEKINLKENIAILAILTFGAAIAFLTERSLVIIISVLALFGLGLYKTKKLIYSILMPCVSVLIYLVSDAFINMFFYNANFKYTDSLPGVLFYIALSIILSLILSYALGKSIIFISRNKEINIKSKIMIIINITLSITLVLAYYSISKIYTGFVGGATAAVILILLCLFIISTITTSILIVTNFKKQLESSFYKENLDRIQEYSLTIENMYKDLRRFKHDYTNILITLKEYIDKEEIKELKEYFNNTILDTSEIIGRVDSISKLSNIRIIPIKALVSSKLIKAENLGIKINVDVEELSYINIDHIDLARVLGITLDNAIEGALEAEIKFINFGFVYKGNSKILIIENSSRKDLPPIYKLMETGFSTKGENRGLGLSNLKEILIKYNNVSYNLENANGIFKIELWFRNT